MEIEQNQQCCSALVHAILGEKSMILSSSIKRKFTNKFIESERKKKVSLQTASTVDSALKAFLPRKKCISNRRIDSIGRLKDQFATFATQDAFHQNRKSKILKHLKNYTTPPVNDCTFTNIQNLRNFASHYSNRKGETICKSSLFEKYHTKCGDFFTQRLKAWQISNKYLEYIMKEIDLPVAEIIRTHNLLLDGVMCSIDGKFGFITKDKCDSLEIAFPIILNEPIDAKNELYLECTVYYKIYSKTISHDILMFLPPMKSERYTKASNPFYHDVRLNESELAHIKTLYGVLSNTKYLRHQ